MEKAKMVTEWSAVSDLPSDLEWRVWKEEFMVEMAAAKRLEKTLSWSCPLQTFYVAGRKTGFCDVTIRIPCPRDQDVGVSSLKQQKSLGCPLDSLFLSIIELVLAHQDIMLQWVCTVK
jgi:hypothetical protein